MGKGSRLVNHVIVAVSIFICSVGWAQEPENKTGKKMKARAAKLLEMPKPDAMDLSSYSREGGKGSKSKGGKGKGGGKDDKGKGKDGGGSRADRQ